MNKTISLTLLLSLALLACSCKKDLPSSQLRGEYIKVYQTAASQNMSSVQVPFEGAQDAQLHILSNVSLQWKYYVNPESDSKSWLTIKDVTEIEKGHFVVTYDAQSLIAENVLDRREGHLSFFNTSESLGKFIPIRQGYSNQFTDGTEGEIVLTGNDVFTTREFPVLTKDYCDYIAFNAWAVTENDFLTKNLTLDIEISGGVFHWTGRTTYTVNVPIGTQADGSNFKILLVTNNGERMSPQTKFTFRVNNDDNVFVHVSNLSGYKVTEAEMIDLFEDEEFFEEEPEEWI